MGLRDYAEPGSKPIPSGATRCYTRVGLMGQDRGFTADTIAREGLRIDKATAYKDQFGEFKVVWATTGAPDWETVKYTAVLVEFWWEFPPLDRPGGTNQTVMIPSDVPPSNFLTVYEPWMGYFHDFKESRYTPADLDNENAWMFKESPNPRDIPEEQWQKAVQYFRKQGSGNESRALDGGLRMEYVPDVGPGSGLSGIRIVIPGSEREIGFLAWKNGVVEHVEVAEEFRRKGFATAMFNWAKEIEPDLQHSTKLLPDGREWVQSFGSLDAVAGSDTVVLWRGVADWGGDDGIWEDGALVGQRPWETAEALISAMQEDWSNYGTWWGSEAEAKFYAGGYTDTNGGHNGLVIAARFPADLPTEGDYSGVTVPSGTVAEIERVEVWTDDGWQVLPHRSGLMITAAWTDVRAKAKHIADEGFVRIIAVADDSVTAEVKGDTNTYQTTIMRAPGAKSVGLWSCGCKWSNYSWGRSEPWKKLEGRMCAHALALLYTMQREEMFGGEITEEAETPAWRGDTVLQEGDWKAPARTAFFGGQEVAVGGMLHPLLDVLPGGQVEVGGLGVIDADQVVYPTWHPTRGLTLTGARSDWLVLTGGRTTFGPFLPPHKVAMALPGIDAESTIEEIADALLSRVRQEEPKVTRDFRAAAEEEGGKLEGLDFRIKSRDSLIRKLDLKSTKGLTPAQLTDSIKDALRYTVVFDPVEWGDAVQDTLWDLEDRGYRVVEEENYWQKGDSYSGLHYTLQAPSGFSIELQFHTDGSYDVKERKIHKFYEEMRDKSTPVKRQQELYDLMTSYYQDLDLPDFALEFPELKMKSRPAMLVRQANGGEGVMIAIRPPQELCEALHAFMTGVYPDDTDRLEGVENYHVTVAYIPAQDGLSRAELHQAVTDANREWAGRWTAPVGHIGGIGVFHNGDKVLVALMDVPRLEAMREDLLEILSVRGITVPATHGYTAHLTIGYWGEANAPTPPQELPANLTEEVPFTEAIAAVDEDWNHYAFNGPRVAVESSVEAASYEELAGNAGRTQIARGSNVSVPTRTLIDKGLIRGRVLHHGAGRAQADTAAMLDAGADAVVEYDPYHPDPIGRDRSVLGQRYDVVVSNYVLNVLPPEQRREVLRDLAKATGGHTYVAVRGIGDTSIKGTPFADGVETSRGTFQRGYRATDLESELAEWFSSVRIVSGNTRSPGTVIAEVSGPHPERVATLHDEPEPALPSTDGADDEDDDMDIAESARRVLASMPPMAKAAMKTFSPAEQREIIDEGHDVRAANLDRLDITGTHYEALEAMRSESDDEWSWL
jgi:2'-5' RNA ligase/GNAT superfamily N-acetyltransferase